MSSNDTPAKPILRQLFDAAEREVAPRLEQLVRTERFAIAAGLASQVQRTVQKQARRSTRRMLHLLNLPAGTDVSRILNEIGQLKQQVRDLTEQLDQKEAALHAVTPRTQRSARSRPA